MDRRRMDIGDIVAGRYRLEAGIGSGGGGEVWRAEDLELHRTVALKHALIGNDAAAAERTDRLRREGRILASVNHPNVVTLFDVLSEDDEWWLVMEFVQAPSLDKHKPMAPKEVARLGVQLAQALEEVHALGVVHRDVKPHNVFITEHRQAKLGDFGVSRVLWTAETLTGTGMVIGTPAYMAPEVANGGTPTAASDMFSLGATLFYALEGSPPSSNDVDTPTLLRRARYRQPPPTDKAGPLAPVLADLLHPNPRKRPTAAEARLRLQQVADSEKPGGPRLFSWGMPAGAVAAVAGVAAVAVAVAGTWAALMTVLGSDDDDSVGDTPRAAGSSSASGGGHDDGERTGPPRLLGNAQTADPCSLISADPLRNFGDADLDTNYGGFERCDVIVEEGESEVDVRVELGKPDEDLDLQGTRVQRAGLLRIAREPVDDGECERTVVLPDDHVVSVTAAQYGDGPAALCGMADAVTEYAVEALSRGQIARRAPTDPSSLVRVDACALLDTRTLSSFPGVDASDPEVSFGRWECKWFSTTDPIALRLRFDQDLPMTAEDGRPVVFAEHRGFVVPEGYGEFTCQVSIPHRQYEDTDGVTMVEYLLVIVEGEEPMRRMCDRATEFAEPAAANLP